MAGKRTTYRLAAVGLSETERQILRSAIGSTTSLLNVEFDWSEPERAAIWIVNLARPQVLSQVRENSRRAPVRLTSSSEGSGAGAQLGRPLRIRQLVDALRQALA